MDEIKSSYPSVNKIIENYNSKIYLVTFVEIYQGCISDWKQNAFNTETKAIRYLISCIENLVNNKFNDERFEERIDDIREFRKEYFECECQSSSTPVSPTLYGDCYYSLKEEYWSYNDNKKNIKTIDKMIEYINYRLMVYYETRYEFNIKESDIN